MKRRLCVNAINKKNYHVNLSPNNIFTPTHLNGSHCMFTVFLFGHQPSTPPSRQSTVESSQHPVVSAYPGVGVAAQHSGVNRPGVGSREAGGGRREARGARGRRKAGGGRRGRRARCVRARPSAPVCVPWGGGGRR